MKILFIGSPGSGKSTMASKLHILTNLPLIRLDDHYWLEQWQRPLPDEWLKTVYNLVSKDQWIIDGNYFSSIDIRLAAADMVVFLDTPTWICLLRVFVRAIKRRLAIDKESLPIRIRCNVTYTPKLNASWHFISLILFYKLKLKPTIVRKLNASKAEIIILKNECDIDWFLRNFQLRYSKKV